MFKKNLRTIIITSVIILIPIVCGLIIWDQLPEKIPTHWNISGEIDGWSSKLFAVIGLPLILLGIHWICAFATVSDPKNSNNTGKILNLSFWISPILSVLLGVISYSAALGNTVRVEVILPVFTGLLFTVIGNYLPKCKQSYTVGIKLPWTLNSEENWYRTHRLAGRVMVICGIAIILSGFFGALWLILVSAVPMVAIPLVYSYILHRKGI